ncbi:glycosyltransferase [Anaerovibrio lipolyticus]|uniref:glycosyltransferase n=1 Tax=Anaerovibrio lipolyticus TaxID=82374 RepID=UPI0026EE13E1|nr:glycosyltransferase [Anaerovibrio lipolyticus]MBE6105138.1 glycosyltransferase [Anaerovibrio lipolyticus]
MKISAVYIAKNEAHNIARSLESIKEAVDELILVDTGSADDTVKIFQSYGGQVFYRQWDEDFSAPRNLALSKATGDWIIILDADESFSEATRKNIRGVLASCSPSAKGLLINMVNYDRDTGEALDEFYALRIVRNLAGLNYKGVVHEQLYIGEDSFYDSQRVAKELLTIDHTGYTASISKEKNQRNLRLMQAAIAGGEPEERYYTSLYESYTALGDTEKALHYARLDVERGRQPITYASRSYRGLMRYYARTDTMEKKLLRCKLTAQAVKDFPELPDFHAEHSESLYQLGRYREAKSEIDMALSLYKNYDGMEPCLLTSEMIPIMKRRQEEMNVMAEQNRDIKISACVIVKNEERNIGGWLENVRAFADEIIINDTGSEDGTKNIITKFSEENPDLDMVLVESVWQDDFAFAKNQCIDEATGDWIVFTDADELFVEPEFVKGYLYNLRNDKEVQALFVPMANIEASDGSVINYFNALRIFRRLEGIHYEGRIHESLALAGRETEMVTHLADKSLLIHHTGYSRDISPQKAQRNLRLMELDIAAGQDIRKLYRYLAECCYMLKNYQSALDNALLATQSPYQPIGQQGDMYWLALNAMEKLAYSHEDRLAIADNGIRLFPELPDFYARRGMILTEAGAYGEASSLFQQSLERLETYNRQDTPTESSNIASVMHELYADLGSCLFNAGEKAAAEAMYRTALNINPWTEKALCGWGDIYDGRPERELLEGLRAVYQTVPDYEPLLQTIFAANGFVELAEYFGGENQQALIRVKSYPWIYNRAMKELAVILPYLYVCLLEHYDEEFAKMVPRGLGNMVKYFHGLADENAIKGHYEEYKTFIREVFAIATPDTVSKYIDMLPLVSASDAELEQHLIEVAGMLLKADKTELALELYNQIPADSVQVNKEFWQRVGICFYNLGQYQAAMECLERAQQDKRTLSYRTWCREAMENGN